MNKSILINSAIAITLLLLSTGSAFAAGNTTYGGNQCQPIYGGGDSCPKTPQFEINKTVQNPKTQVFVDNLSVSDPRFAPTQIVPFKITVKNTSDVAISNVVIKDILPDFVDFSGGIGNFDTNNKTLTITLDKLEANESRDFFVQAKVRAADKLPGDQNVTCVVNQSIIVVGDKKSQDNSGFCIEKGAPVPTQTPNNPSTPNNPPTTKGGLPINPETPAVNPPTTKGGLPVFPPTKATTTPQTGPEALSLLGLIPTALGGFLLRRKTKQV